MSVNAASDPEKDAWESVRQVTARIIETITALGYTATSELASTMPGQYIPGFVEAHRRDGDFWKEYGGKVLRMAGYAAAFACFVVDRTRAFEQRDYPLEVGVREWRMGMGIVRSACLAGNDPKRHGIPCNHENFRLKRDTKRDVVGVLAGIIADLMTDD